jgi:hypothetical protein
LEKEAETLHAAVRGTEEEPLLVRYVGVDKNFLPEAPDKEMYVTFFAGVAAAFPILQEGAVKSHLRDDIERVGAALLKNELVIKREGQTVFGFTPYLNLGDMRTTVHSLITDSDRTARVSDLLQNAERVMPYRRDWRDIDKTRAALERKDEERAFGLAVPAINAGLNLLEQLRDILIAPRHRVFLPDRFYGDDYLGRSLADNITNVVQRFPRNKDGLRLYKLSDFRVMALNTLLALHIIRASFGITELEQFQEYYGFNLYTQDALLQTTMDWYGVDEELARSLLGNGFADRTRDNFLAGLALSNLVTTETNSIVRDKYLDLLDRWWQLNRYEDNPLYLAWTMACSEDQTLDSTLILRDLEIYPEAREAPSKDSWRRSAKKNAVTWSGGWANGYSREPMPVSMRPISEFLWKDNPRNLEAAEAKRYPPVDFLYLYWYCRAHDLFKSEIELLPPRER